MEVRDFFGKVLVVRQTPLVLPGLRHYKLGGRVLRFVFLELYK